MAMPMGHRIKVGYATVTDAGGLDYREVARIMTEDGYSMNHATARNVLLSAMEKFAQAVLMQNGVATDLVAVKRLARDPSFQDGLSQLIQEELLGPDDP